MSASSYVPGIPVSRSPTPLLATPAFDVSTTGVGTLCSVKGCNMPLTSNNKMCKTCRERHRVYAVTKRLRRKAEKATAAEVVPGNEDTPLLTTGPTTEESGTPAPSAEPSGTSTDANEAPSSSTTQSTATVSAIPDYSRPETWGVSNYNIDPRSLPPYSSELLGALNPKAAPSPLLVNTALTSTKIRSLKAARYCSVKGCKRVMPDDYFFKMCDPCRVRYRGYGSTKRAKWKQDKDQAQLEGASTRSDTVQPGGEEAGGTTEKNGLGAFKPPMTRMCSVSHCREFLAVGSFFKRCDQHRIQNRHHSRLKREREKEVKAQAMAAWAKASAPEPDTPVANEESPSTNVSMDLDSDNREPPATTEKKIGVGTPIVKRINDTCSVRICHNLLDPQVPWEMCESCREPSRERDRMIKHKKSLRTTSKSFEAPTVSDVPRRLEPDGVLFVNRDSGSMAAENQTNSNESSSPTPATSAPPSQTSPVNVVSARQFPLPSIAPLPENPGQQPKKKAKKKRSKLISTEDSNPITAIPAQSSPARENTVPVQATATPAHPASALSSQLPMHSTMPYNAAIPPLHRMPPPGGPHYGPVPLPHYYHPYYAYGTPTYYPYTGKDGHGMPSGASGSYAAQPPGFQPPHPQYMTPYPYPYQYSYPHPYPYPYPYPPGQNIPAHQARLYDQLQWDTVMTPQTTPAYARVEAQVATPGPSTQLDQTVSARKRKRKDQALDTGGGSARIEELPSAPKAPTVEAAKEPSPKRQVFSCMNTTCERTVALSNVVCERCKETLRRRRLKARKRFKLGPEGLRLGQSITTKPTG